MGESGCGKTTTVLGILRLLPPGGLVVGGSVWFDGEDLLGLDADALRKFRWTHLSLVFQGAMNALNPVRTVGDQIAEAVRLHAPDTSKAEAAAEPPSSSSEWVSGGGVRTNSRTRIRVGCDSGR